MGKIIKNFNGLDIKKRIIEHHKNIGYQVDEKGYVSKIEDNLLTAYPNWNEIRQELEKGDGSELSLKNGRAKFQAVHSSSALCVNTFSMVKLHKKEMSLFKTDGFKNAEFEKN
ncbi:MAG: hypothetical protein FWG07_03345 [Treponema sp.]|nr:hypothetical protein [Treponema sp.]